MMVDPMQFLYEKRNELPQKEQFEEKEFVQYQLHFGQHRNRKLAEQKKLLMFTKVYNYKILSAHLHKKCVLFIIFLVGFFTEK